MTSVAALATMAGKTADYLRTNLAPLRPPLAYVGGWLGRDNLGDEALFQAAQRLFPRFALWHFDGSRTVRVLARAVPRTTAGLFAGGTLINRAPEYLELARSFLTARRSLHFFGVGVADPAFWTGRSDFRDMLPHWVPLLNRAGPVGVRGPRSAELLTAAGVREVAVVGDPVLAFARSTRAAPPAVPHLGLNIGHDHGHQWGCRLRLHDETRALARCARAAGWDVTWFVVYPEDLPVTRGIAAASGTAERIVCAYHRPKTYLDAVSSMTFFVGMKLHATMLALCAHVPSLMLEYEPKCGDFMASLGLGAEVRRTDRFTAAEAWDQLHAWLPDREARSRDLFRRVHELRTRQEAAACRLSQQIAAS